MVNPHASALGKIRSSKKAAAARTNGKKNVAIYAPKLLWQIRQLWLQGHNITQIAKQVSLCRKTVSKLIKQKHE